jgi:hypothetical protein
MYHKDHPILFPMYQFNNYSKYFFLVFRQPRSQGFSLFVIGKAGKGPGTGRSHDFQHPDIVGVINYNKINNNELENPRWPPT